MSDPADISKIHASVAAYYSNKLALHGATARGVDWNDDASHRLRHRQFLRLFDGHIDGITADVGCGYGHFLGFLRENGYRGEYIGYDISSAMIAAAQELHGYGADRRWILGNPPIKSADYVIASGIFNVKQDCPTAIWEDYVNDTIARMAAAAQRGFGFNVLSSHCDAERVRPNLFYADPSNFLDRIVRRFGRHIALLQDYGLYEFTVLVRHDPIQFSQTANPNPVRP